MHRILLREVVIDSPTATFAATRDFWSRALMATPSVIDEHPEFTALSDPAALVFVGLQDVGSDRPRYHLDIETDDVEAEVIRLTGLGAVEVARPRTWVVMRDPAGLLFCVVAVASPDFERRARTVA
jgi:hypothetical protein